MSSLSTLLSPDQRQEYLQKLFVLEGLTHVTENELAAYCPISLTSTPTVLKPYLAERQRVLMEEVLQAAGITAYDPATAPFSPDKNLHSQPNEIYVVDSGKIASARFFVGHNILPSTGFGVEVEKAKEFNRISVILMDKNIRVSRMQPHRAIYLQYENFAEQASEFVKVFEVLKNYDPGIGLEGNVPVLIGADKKTGKVENLEKKIYDLFHELKYDYQGTSSVVDLVASNPVVFCEHIVT
jgi:hypothetical protein